ncbi:MAG: hypothetical protein KBA31_19600 [Alphaproteobacteria bacterium]|nr:hypothetical protein [Alphaproteobacteria bacterium]
MCHPVVMAGLQVATSVMGASAQASDLKYQAKISKMQAENAFKVAAAQAEFSRYAAERRQASDRVAVFTSGVDPQSASAVDVLSENRGNLAVEELNAFYKGQVALYEGQIQAQTFKRAARSALQQSLIAGAGSLLGAGIKQWGTAAWEPGGSSAESSFKLNKLIRPTDPRYT